MMSISFNVNDGGARKIFLSRDMFLALDGLGAQSRPLWGRMTPQLMVEHMLWAFQCWTGKLSLSCHTPGSALERVKRFLYDSRDIPPLFRNPVLGEYPPPLHEANLRREVDLFDRHFRDQPGVIHTHPVSGPLGAEEWHRSHFKLRYHHLLQFGLISKPG